GARILQRRVALDRVGGGAGDVLAGRDVGAERIGEAVAVAKAEAAVLVAVLPGREGRRQAERLVRVDLHQSGDAIALAVGDVEVAHVGLLAGFDQYRLVEIRSYM